MRRTIHLTARAIAAAASICALYVIVSQDELNRGWIFYWTAMCAIGVARVTELWAVNSATRATIWRIIGVLVVTGIFSGLGILVVMVAGPDSAIGRAATYATLGIWALGTGFGMAYGYS